MTEAEFHSIARRNQPLYDDTHILVVTLLDRRDTDYDACTEARTLTECQALLADPTCKLRGGIRYHAPNKATNIHAIFWRLRTSPAAPALDRPSPPHTTAVASHHTTPV